MRASGSGSSRDVQEAGAETPSPAFCKAQRKPPTLCPKGTIAQADRFSQETRCGPRTMVKGAGAMEHREHLQCMGGGATLNLLEAASG